MEFQVLLSIYRHWLWADRMRELFEHYLRCNLPPSVDQFTFDEAFFTTSMVTCMSLWYGLLFAACDGLEKASGLSVSEISSEYARVRELLRRFRNAVFHVQPDYWSEKLMAVLREEQLATAIRAVHRSVGAWLETQVKQQSEALPEGPREKGRA